MKDYSGKRVALIDDNIINLKLAKKKLAPYNFIVDEGYHANKLFELMKNNDYDLLILDDMMPDISGTEAMKRLKETGYSKPIIVLTGNDQPDDRQKYLEDGFDEYLAKPIDEQDLERVLKLFLG